MITAEFSSLRSNTSVGFVGGKLNRMLFMYCHVCDNPLKYYSTIFVKCPIVFNYTLNIMLSMLPLNLKIFEEDELT